jgi:hypothetical protein
MKRLLLLISSLLFVAIFLPATVQAQTPGPDIGAFLPLANDNDPSPWNFTDFQNNTQHHLDVFLWYFDIIDQQPDWSRLAEAAGNGSKIQLAWLPWDPYAPDPVNNPQYKLTNITNGNFDADIHRWANEIKSFPYTILFRPMGEMNGNWLPWACGNVLAEVAPVNGNSPEDYIPAYQHVHDIFEAEGVTNVEWVWAPNRDGPINESTPGTAIAQYTFDTYYPGDEYVDYIGIDGYNWGNEYEWSNWQDLGEVFGYSYDVFRNGTVNSNPKPKLMIAEMSSTENGAPVGSSKASWITDAYNAWLPYRFPDLVNVTWFSEAGDVDFRITSSTESQNAFLTAMQSLYDRSYFTNYFPNDISYAQSWMLGANPASVNNSNGITPRLQVSSTPFGFPATGSDEVQNASPVLSTGPAKLTTPQLNALTHTSTKVVGSQRTLWHNPTNGGISFEEVSARYFKDLSDHYYWPWHDSTGSFSADYLSVANPNPFPMYFEAKYAGQQTLLAWGIVPPNQIVAPALSGSGGPLEIQFWVADPANDSNPGVQRRLAPAKGVPSQRVYYNNWKDYTEIPGTPAEELSDRYLWPWYHDASGVQDWVVIANPNSARVDYTVKIHAATVATGTLEAAGQAGDHAAPRFEGTMNGPVEVVATYDTGGQPAKVIASQRSLWPGSSAGFEEVAGLPASQEGVSHLRSSYYWPFYDQLNPGVTDWLLLANPGTGQVTYTVKIAGVPIPCPQDGCRVPAGTTINHTFPGTQSGPVEVTVLTPDGEIVASQRVLWSSNFNELLGTITDSAD